jgi:hypothetical protein
MKRKNKRKKNSEKGKGDYCSGSVLMENPPELVAYLVAGGEWCMGVTVFVYFILWVLSTAQSAALRSTAHCRVIGTTRTSLPSAAHLLSA